MDSEVHVITRKNLVFISCEKCDGGWGGGGPIKDVMGFAQRLNDKKK